MNYTYVYFIGETLRPPSEGELPFRVQDQETVLMYNVLSMSFIDNKITKKRFLVI